MPRGRADIANTAIRIFLQQMGAAYDGQRGLEVYDSKKHFVEVRAFFDERCCYCGDTLLEGQIAQDHLVPMNKTSLGLHAWGNIVPTCAVCNAKKQGNAWTSYLFQRAGADAHERNRRITDFVAHHDYAPDLAKLRDVVEGLYSEVGLIAMNLISLTVKRMQDGLQAEHAAVAPGGGRGARGAVRQF